MIYNGSRFTNLLELPSTFILSLYTWDGLVWWCCRSLCRDWSEVMRMRDPDELLTILLSLVHHTCWLYINEILWWDLQLDWKFICHQPLMFYTKKDRSPYMVFQHRRGISMLSLTFSLYGSNSSQQISTMFLKRVKNKYDVINSMLDKWKKYLS